MNKQILKHVIRYILMVLIILVCIKIFKLSSENAIISSNTSKKFTEGLVVTFNKGISTSETNNKVIKLEPIVRKLAHFSIYILLGILTMGCMETFSKTKIKKAYTSICFTFIYACSDEFHQKFVEGRSSEFRDVLIDTSGALVGIAIILLFMFIFYKKRNNKIDNTKKDKRKIIFMASTGGHLNELMQVKTMFNNYDYTVITEKTEVDKSLINEYGKRIKFLIYGTKKYPVRYFFKFIYNCILSLIYYFKFQPEVIVTTGTHTAVPMCYIAKTFGSKVIFIETFANRTTGTVAGKLIYPIADVFVVQWEEMKKVYPKAVCWGWIY